MVNELEGMFQAHCALQRQDATGGVNLLSHKAGSPRHSLVYALISADITHIELPWHHHLTQCGYVAYDGESVAEAIFLCAKPIRRLPSGQERRQVCIMSVQQKGVKITVPEQQL